MTPFFVGLAVVLGVVAGFVMNEAIWRARIRSERTLKQIVDRARQQGRLDRAKAERGGNEPPAWMEE